MCFEISSIFAFLSQPVNLQGLWWSLRTFHQIQFEVESEHGKIIKSHLVRYPLSFRILCHLFRLPESIVSFNERILCTLKGQLTDFFLAMCHA